MNLNQIIIEEKRLREIIDREYVGPTQESKPISKPIYDGIVNPEQYISSSPRILWILKEPYDKGTDYTGGGYSITDNLLNKDTNRMSRARAYQPICYINYGIWENVHAWDQMPRLKDCEKMRNGLRKIAYINISKLPGLKQTPWKRIVQAYQKYHHVIRDQISTYAPNIIFSCNPHANMLPKDLGLTTSQWQPFGSAAAILISSEQRLVRVAHPSCRMNRAAYIDDAIKAATNDLAVPQKSA